MLFYLLGLCIVGGMGAVYAQDADDMLRYSPGDYSPAFAGKIPLPYASYLTNYPYLKTGDLVEGELMFGGISYANVRMRLDTYRDNLLAAPPGGGYEVILPPEEVGYAVIHGYHVFYHRPDSIKGSPPQGYYMLLYDGGCRVMARALCTMREVSSGGTTTGWFRYATRYYVVKDGVCHTVSGKGALLKLFPAHRRELSRFISGEGLNFRRNAEGSIVSVVKYYEQLNADR
jgi:hypothetical protein